MIYLSFVYDFVQAGSELIACSPHVFYCVKSLLSMVESDNIKLKNADARKLCLVLNQIHKELASQGYVKTQTGRHKRMFLQDSFAKND